MVFVPTADSFHDALNVTQTSAVSIEQPASMASSDDGPQTRKLVKQPIPTTRNGVQNIDRLKQPADAQKELSSSVRFTEKLIQDDDTPDS